MARSLSAWEFAAGVPLFRQIRPVEVRLEAKKLAASWEFNSPACRMAAGGSPKGVGEDGVRRRGR